jgi:hypothetical protein
MCDLCGAPGVKADVVVSPADMRAIAAAGHGAKVARAQGPLRSQLPAAERQVRLMLVAAVDETPWTLCAACHASTRERTRPGTPAPSPTADALARFRRAAEGRTDFKAFLNGLNRKRTEAPQGFFARRKAAARDRSPTPDDQLQGAMFEESLLPFEFPGAWLQCEPVRQDECPGKVPPGARHLELLRASPDPVERMKSVEQLRRSPSYDSLSALLRALDEDPHGLVRKEAADALGHFPLPKLVPYLLRAYVRAPQSVEDFVALFPTRCAVARSLASIGGDAALRALRHIRAWDPDLAVRELAVAGLAARGDAAVSDERKR